MIISINGAKWKIEQKSTFRDIAWEFELNQEFDTTAADGREVKSTFTFEDGKLIHVEKAKTAGEVNSKVVRLDREWQDHCGKPGNCLDYAL